MFPMFRMLIILASQTMSKFYFQTFQSLLFTTIVFTYKIHLSRDVEFIISSPEAISQVHGGVFNVRHDWEHLCYSY